MGLGWYYRHLHVPPALVRGIKLRCQQDQGQVLPRNRVRASVSAGGRGRAVLMQQRQEVREMRD